MNKNIRKIIAIVGPTASGKTAVAVRIAKKFNGEIVSADSRQVYRGLNLGTGKEGLPCQQDTITKKQETKNQQYNNKTIKQLSLHRRWIDGIPQWMIDVVDPEEKFTLFDYLPLARAAIEDIFSRGKLPIIVGGTGLYVQALVEGFQLEKSEIRNPKSETNSKYQIQNNINSHPEFISGSLDDGMLKQVQHDEYDRQQLNNKTVEQLQKILRKIDEKSFADLVDQQNPHRLIRAIEKAQSGEAVTKTKPDFEVLQIGLDWPREELYKKIDQRVDERFRQGMLGEVEGLIKSGVDPEWLLGLGLEYRIITQFLISVIPDLIRNLGNAHANQLSGSQIKSGMTTQVAVEFEKMKNLLKLRSHQYAKRQLTWFRRFKEIVWEKDYEKIDKLVEEYLS